MRASGRSAFAPSRQIAEIAGDPALRIYGACLTCAHILNFVTWSLEPLDAVIARGSRTLCWPFLEGCHAWRVLDPAQVQILLWAYLALATFTLSLFALARGVRGALALLAAITGLQAAIVFQDFALTLNHHYMLGFTTLVFLAVPHKRRALPFLIVAFYFWAGVLKLQGEWLSGAILAEFEGFWLPRALLPAAAAYAVVLELAIVFGLLARRAWIFWSAFAQILLFHVVSFSIVGFHYPSLMVLLLAIFPLCRCLPSRGPDASLGTLLRGREPRSSYALLGLFSLLQLVPRAIPGDQAVTGEGRIFALDMFDARVECEGSLVIHGVSGRTRREVVSQRGLEKRIRCDPIVYWGVARQRCREARADPSFRDLDLHLESRRSFDAGPRSVIALEDFCHRSPSYDVWRRNDWILAQGEGVETTAR